MKAIARYSDNGSFVEIDDGGKANFVVKIFFPKSKTGGVWDRTISIEQRFISWDMHGIPCAATLTSYHSYIMTKEKR